MRAAGCVCVKAAEVAAAGRRSRDRRGPGRGCPRGPLCPAEPDTRSERSGRPEESGVRPQQNNHTVTITDMRQTLNVPP